MTDRQQTHNAGCWRDPKHHDCAVRRIEELEAEHEQDDWLLSAMAGVLKQIIEMKSDPVSTQAAGHMSPNPAEVVAALVADKRRLDWVAECGSVKMTRLISLEGGRWSDPFFEIETSDDYYKAPTMRDAIDKAMEADHD